MEKVASGRRSMPARVFIFLGIVCKGNSTFKDLEARPVVVVVQVLVLKEPLRCLVDVSVEVLGLWGKFSLGISSSEDLQTNGKQETKRSD